MFTCSFLDAGHLLSIFRKYEAISFTSFLMLTLACLQPSGESIAPIIASLVNGFSLFESSIVVLHVRTGTSVFAEVRWQTGAGHHSASFLGSTPQGCALLFWMLFVALLLLS